METSEHSLSSIPEKFSNSPVPDEDEHKKLIAAKKLQDALKENHKIPTYPYKSPNKMSNRRKEVRHNQTRRKSNIEIDDIFETAKRRYSELLNEQKKNAQSSKRRSRSAEAKAVVHVKETEKGVRHNQTRKKSNIEIDDIFETANRRYNALLNEQKKRSRSAEAKSVVHVKETEKEVRHNQTRRSRSRSGLKPRRSRSGLKPGKLPWNFQKKDQILPKEKPWYKKSKHQQKIMKRKQEKLQELQQQWHEMLKNKKKGKQVEKIQKSKNTLPLPFGNEKEEMKKNEVVSKFNAEHRHDEPSNPIPNPDSSPVNLLDDFFENKKNKSRKKKKLTKEEDFFVRTYNFFNEERNDRTSNQGFDFNNVKTVKELGTSF